VLRGIGSERKNDGRNLKKNERKKGGRRGEAPVGLVKKRLFARKQNSSFAKLTQRPRGRWTPDVGTTALSKTWGEQNDPWKDEKNHPK